MAMAARVCQCWLALAVCLGSIGALAERRLLSEEDFSGLVDHHMKDEKSDASSQSLGRMLLAFQVLNQLGERKSLGDKDLGLKDKDILSKDGLKDKLSKDGLKDKFSKDGLKDKFSKDALKEKLGGGGEVLGASTVEGSLENAADGAANALADYLNNMIAREQALLQQYSKGAVDDQFSYLVDLPETGIQQQILPIFGVVNSGTLVNTTQALKEQFCSPMAALPRRFTGRRAIINGPSFELTLSTGSCQMSRGVGDDNIPFTFVKQKTMSCSGHEVSYTKTPLSINRRDILPEAFASEECKVTRDFGTAFERVLYGGGPLIRFDTLDEFVDAVVTRKYSFFDGIDVGVLGENTLGGGQGGGKYGKFSIKDKFGKDKLDLDKFGKELFDKDPKKGKFDKKKGKGKGVDFWSPLGPGRLLKHKKALKRKKFEMMGLGALLDFQTTSPVAGLRNLLDADE
ncbi:hypothetical protein BSKO_10558 [Bryopsis sp. KO-2023]|nr:hypothetical protein BSKO_10558 [Bryopsis sp. KO-2023]